MSSNRKKIICQEKGKQYQGREMKRGKSKGRKKEKKVGDRLKTKENKEKKYQYVTEEETSNIRGKKEMGKNNKKKNTGRKKNKIRNEKMGDMKGTKERK